MQLKGNGVSGGIALGKIYLYKAFQCNVTAETFTQGEEQHYLQQWADAKTAAQAELEEIIRSMTAAGNDKAKIFTAHIEILQDEEIDELVTKAIRDKQSMPDWAIDCAFNEFIELLSGANDLLIAERVADLRDVRARLLRVLKGKKEKNLSHLSEQVIVVARDLLPSDTATLDRSKVIGIVTEVGGATSHSAILARGYRIPAVLGVPGATDSLQDGTFIVLDGTSGLVLTEPTDDDVTRYKKKQADYLAQLAAEEEFLHKDAALRCGQRIKIGVNLGNKSTPENFVGSDFVGLLRTEFLYMGSDHMPTEQEQYEAYKLVVEHAEGRPVTLRTLDVGGDKTLSYLPLPKEDNPFLGKRAVRLCFELPDLFKTQLRAALRASAAGPLQIMFPMVGSIDDVRRAKAFVEEAKAELDARGEAYDKNIRLGVMIEIPSIAAIADLVAKEVDFGSIGTNDLCQYLCAVDRMNPDISDYYQTFSPALIRVIGQIIEQFDAHGKEISMCGELAGDARAAILLAGLGLRKFSMSPSSVARVKQALSRFTLQEAQQAAATAKNLATQQEVFDFLASCGK